MDEVARRHLPDGIAPTLEWIEIAEHWLRRQAYYLRDYNNPIIGHSIDDWRTLLPEILRRRERGDTSQVGDDCDAWSLTAIDIAREAGVPPGGCRLLAVNSLLGQLGSYDMDHMIAALRLEGRWWVVGDTLRVGPYPAEECLHALFARLRLPLRDHNWRKVRDWSEV